MAVMTWDSQLQAFVGSETPLTYNQGLEAWQETEGNLYNPAIEAWEKVWPTRKYLYRRGDVSTLIGGFDKYIYFDTYYNADGFSVTYDNDKITMNSIGAAGNSNVLLGSKNKVDLTGYKTLTAIAEMPVYDQRYNARIYIMDGMPKAENSIRPSGNLDSSGYMIADISDLSGFYTVCLRGCERCIIHWYEIYLD